MAATSSPNMRREMVVNPSDENDACPLTDIDAGDWSVAVNGTVAVVKGAVSAMAMALSRIFGADVGAVYWAAVFFFDEEHPVANSESITATAVNNMCCRLFIEIGFVGYFFAQKLV